MNGKKVGEIFGLPVFETDDLPDVGQVVVGRSLVHDAFAPITFDSNGTFIIHGRLTHMMKATDRAAAVDALAAAMRKNHTCVTVFDQTVDLTTLEPWPLLLEAERQFERTCKFPAFWKLFRRDELRMRGQNLILQQAFLQDYFLQELEKRLAAD